MDETKEIHDKIGGPGFYDKTLNTILDYISGTPRKGKPFRKDIWITITINSINYSIVTNLDEAWNDKINKIGYQFHTPFVKGEP